MSVSKYLAIDLGAESGRAIVGLIENNNIRLEEVYRFPNKQITILGHLHWDVLSLFDEIKNGIRSAVKKGHADIKSVGIDTWGVDFGFITKQDELIGFPYCYRDTRTSGIMEKVFEIIPKEKIYSVTGIQFWQFNSLFQLAKYIDEDSELIKIADKLLFMPDIFNFLLTGIITTEYTIASTSQLLNAINKNWDHSLLNKLRFPSSLFNKIIPSGTIIGKLRADIADEIGINEIDVIAPGCHDTASAVAAIPLKDKSSAFISSGTWSIIGIESDEPIINEDTYRLNFTNEGGVGGKIRFTSNMMGMWLLQQLRKSWKKKNEEISYEEMSLIAGESESNRTIIDPDDQVFYNPDDMQEAINNYCFKNDLKLPETKAQYIRCVLDSLAQKYSMMISNIEALTNHKIKQLHIVGGGSQNNQLNQLTANACKIPVIAGPVEATALGNIIVQAIALGNLSSVEEGRNIIENSFMLSKFNLR
jgi:rhamnulokinase